MDSLLADTKTIYVSCSGLLHRLNLEAIPTRDGKTIGDRYQIVRLNSTRQLVVPVQLETQEQDAMLYGGIQYEMNREAIVNANQVANTSRINSTEEVPFSFVDSTSRGRAWNYLQGTDQEVDKIAATLTQAGIKTSIRKGYTATEESFKMIETEGSSPRILHLATHGFFFPDPEDQNSGMRISTNTEPVFKMSDHPMIRSGLVLAGGNQQSIPTVAQAFR